MVTALSKLSRAVDGIRLPYLSSYRMIRLRSSQAFIVFVIFMAVFTDIFLYSVVVPVVPFAFEFRMGLAHDEIQSAVSKSLAIYSAGLIVGSIAFGYVCDRLNNRQSSMVAGLVVLIASTVILCLTKSVALFMVGRLLLGMSGGAVWSVGLSVIADTADPDKVAYLMSFPGIGMSLGVFFGPLFGGIIYQNAGYYAVWYVCFGVLVFDVILRLLMIEKKELPGKLARLGMSPEEIEKELARPQAQTEESTMMASVPSEASVEDQPQGGSKEQQSADLEQNMNSEELEPIKLARKLKTSIHIFGRKIALPPIITLLQNVRILTCLFQSFIQAWIMTSVDTTLTIHLNELFGFDSQGAGLVFLAVAVPAVLEPAVGWLSDRFGPKYISALGYLLNGMFLTLLRVPDHHNVGQIVLFVALLALIGVSFTLIFSPMLGDLSTVVAEIEAQTPGAFGPGRGFGQAYALFNCAFSLGALVGPFVAGAIMEHRGWPMTSLTLGIVSFFTFFPTLFITGGNIFYQRK
ncbi:hypothetical protein TRVA0_004S01332 [Trichomonascus vanleenenianus]|uniref:MFS transporter n=1 Tax=Trichomonascus vanleenenianus TaxID=2268995 RepID=UPI003ECA5F4E